MTWELPIGARPRLGGTLFRVWAPQARSVEVVLEPSGRRVALEPEAAGYFAGLVAGVKPGAQYWYSLDGADPRPDPASRFQPNGVHSPSAVVDPGAYQWQTTDWHGRSLDELVIYELHVGTFTPAGTFESAIARLADLVALGVTAIELMPVADFPGDRNWGYDGVNLFAPSRAYGGPEGLRRLVDAAHGHGLAVILDVVYNHLGPDGNYLWSYTRDYFTDRHQTPWGDAINVDGPDSRPVRDFLIGNALYWAHEFQFDGLRLDATHAIIDDSPVHVVAELVATVRASLPAARQFVIIAENDENNPELARPHDPVAHPQRWGLSGLWSDDFNHQVRVALTGEREGYYANYRGHGADLAQTINQGWFFNGQISPGSGKPRGAPAADLRPPQFVFCIQNHDQVGNRPVGDRLHHTVDLAAYRAGSTLLLLCPQTPLLWMGQEWAATSPFLYFTDHNAELGRMVTEGRRREFAGFSGFQTLEVPDPQAETTFLRSKLVWEEREAPPHAAILALYRDLLQLRASHPALRQRERGSYEVMALTQRAVVLEYNGPDQPRLRVVVNLDGHLSYGLGPRSDSDWRILLDSEAAAYGGTTPVVIERQNLVLSGPQAVVIEG
ncbi:MAG: malto-oligosyltrehalose trehalohydrolase [Oscillochloridaceae bacterium umkhey_bin13]